MISAKFTEDGMERHCYLYFLVGYNIPLYNVYIGSKVIATLRRVGTEWTFISNEGVYYPEIAAELSQQLESHPDYEYRIKNGK